MSFGSIMRFAVGNLRIELSPIDKESIGQCIQPGLQQLGVTQFMGHRLAPILEDEYEWLEKVRNDRTSIVWGIWVLLEDGQKLLIGNTALIRMQTDPFRVATSGSLIFRKEYWGKGIASAAHKARTWYAFHHLGMFCVYSQVMQGNGGSSTALSRSGYTYVSTQRNEAFVDGQMRHLDTFECINPNAPFWNQWWHGDTPTEAHKAARNTTRKALAWAVENVELP